MELKPQLLQQQKLVMTMQMRQAIQVLQLNNIEVDQLIEEELLADPALEEGLQVETLRPEEITQQQELQELQKELLEERNDHLESDGLWEAILNREHTDVGKRPRNGYIYNELPAIESNHSASASLIEDLMSQLRLEYCTDGERIAAECIIGNLDHRGYLDCTYHEIQKLTDVDMDDIEGAILIIRELEPVGCGARSLSECLLFQVELQYPEDPFFPIIVQKHLKDIQKRAYHKVAQALDMDIEDVEEYHKMLAKLEPRPARAYDDTPDQIATPDVKVLKIDDEWRVISDDDGLPKVRINQLYKQMQLQQQAASENDKKFIEERLRSAKFLLESLHHRSRTIVRVMESIVRRQLEFFEYGIEHLRPMVLRDVAQDIDVHESTVSRISNGKFVETPKGLLEIKFFFNSSISQIGGLDLASEAVKARIKGIVSAENPKKPYSDSKICTLLEAQGIILARRTVTKYREAMNIPSSRARKERS